MTQVIECRPIDESFYESAPVRYVFERDFDVTPAALFAIFEDAESWPVFTPGIEKVTWTSDQPFGPGTSRTVLFTGGMEVYEHFLIWEPGARMAFYFTGQTQRVWWSFGEHYAVQPLPGGRCHLTWTVAYDPRYVLRAIQPIVSPVMRLVLGKIATGMVQYANQHRPSTIGATAKTG